MQEMVDLLNVFGINTSTGQSMQLNVSRYHLRKRIGELSKCTFSEPPDKTRLFEPHREFVENLKKSKRIRGTACIFHPLYPSLFLMFVKMGMEVSIVVTPLVYERTKDRI